MRENALLFLVCGFKHRLAGYFNCFLKLKVDEMVFLTKSAVKWVVYAMKPDSHSNLTVSMEEIKSQ